MQAIRLLGTLFVAAFDGFRGRYVNPWCWWK